MVLMCHLAVCDGGRRSKLKKALDDQVPEEKRYFGFENIGNTCYCNTLLQVLLPFSLIPTCLLDSLHLEFDLYDSFDDFFWVRLNS